MAAFRNGWQGWCFNYWGYKTINAVGMLSVGSFISPSSLPRVWKVYDELKDPSSNWGCHGITGYSQ